MGVKALPSICQKLLANGMAPDTPAATIQWGTRPNQRTAVATIATLVDAVSEAGISSPAITIVGRVVSMRDTLNWFERRPLFGQTIVVTRTRQQASELSERLEQLGAEVIEAPTIEVVPPADWDEVDLALRDASAFDWILFTSVNGVTQTKNRMLAIGLDARAFGRAKIAAVGDATADAVGRELCLRVDLCPERSVAEALADELKARGEVDGKRHLLLRADIARPILKERLENGGSALLRDVAVYETKRVESLPGQLLDALSAGRVDWMTFTSSSTARNFVELLGSNNRNQLERVKLASIGPITSETIRELGMTPTVEAENYNIGGLVDAIVRASRS
jgi:uroporphyrinogen III methyltransferase/synthase